MSKTISSNLFNKGIFAVAVVAITGVVGAVNFASAAVNNRTSGYGTSGQAVAAAARVFHDKFRGNGRAFAQIVHDIQARYHANRSSNGQAGNAFETQFVAATAAYDASSDAALNTFVSRIDTLNNTAESKDQFIDQFNRAKADYLNSLDAAKNTFAASVSNQGNGANQAKDQFIGSFNTARDNYSNQMEQAKNDFAATLSNN